MKTLKIYYIDNNYINYLRKFDNRVAYNKTKNRPYVGVVYTFNNQLTLPHFQVLNLNI